MHWKQARGLLLHKKGDKENLSNYRLLSISPTLSRFMGSIFCQQLRPILEHHYGPEQHGFRKGHSTISLLHILETIIHNAIAAKKEVIIIQADIAKAFDKVDREALASFVAQIIKPSSPEAAAFIQHMYDGDEVVIQHGVETSHIKILSGIRQGDPLSPALFSALLGHTLAPLIAAWKTKGWGVELNQQEPLTKITILAYADDVTILAANEAQACVMIKEIAHALAGINLQLLPQKCSALSSTSPNGSSTSKIKLGDTRIPIAAELTILGQEIAFRGDSMHTLKHRTRQAWKTAQMNASLLRSTKTSHTKRLRLLQALVKPSILYGCETWKLTPGMIANIITTEGTFTRWCLRKTNRRNEPEVQDEEDEGILAWIQWRATSAREIARSMTKGK